jgi:hypothetical protein
MTEEKQYTLSELKEKLTEKEKNFCHEYVVDWNGGRAARAAGYSEKTCYVIANENLTKPKIKQYINFIKNDYEMLCGISKTKQLQELAKIAYSSIAHLHNTWIELKAFDNLTDDQKAAIESTETKHETKQIFNIESNEKEDVNINYIKIKLYSKLNAIDQINKMMGYHEAEKYDHSSKDGSMTPRIGKVIVNRPKE